MRGLLAIVVVAGCGRFGFVGMDATDGSIDVADAAACSPHDEDGDGVGDDCDLCPDVADDQTDADGDGVGSACDPSDAIPHQVVLFEPFVTMPAGWATTGAATWTVGADGLHVMYMDTSASSFVAPIALTAPITITTRYTIDALDGGTSNHTLSIVDAFELSTEDSQKCGQASPVRISIGHEQSGTTVDATNAPFPDALVAGATYVTTFDDGTANATCTTEVPAIGPGATGSVSRVPYRDSGRAGLRIRSVATTFHSLMIVAPR